MLRTIHPILNKFSRFSVNLRSATTLTRPPRTEKEKIQREKSEKEWEDRQKKLFDMDDDDFESHKFRHQVVNDNDRTVEVSLENLSLKDIDQKTKAVAEYQKHLDIVRKQKLSKWKELMANPMFELMTMIGEKEAQGLSDDFLAQNNINATSVADFHARTAKLWENVRNEFANLSINPLNKEQMIEALNLKKTEKAKLAFRQKLIKMNYVIVKNNRKMYKEDEIDKNAGLFSEIQTKLSNIDKKAKKIEKEEEEEEEDFSNIPIDDDFVSRINESNLFPTKFTKADIEQLHGPGISMLNTKPNLAPGSAKKKGQNSKSRNPKRPVTSGRPSYSTGLEKEEMYKILKGE